jgi:hypothetical protein
MTNAPFRAANRRASIHFRDFPSLVLDQFAKCRLSGNQRSSMRIQGSLVRGILLEPPFSAELYLAKQDRNICRRAVIHLSTR